MIVSRRHIFVLLAIVASFSLFISTAGAYSAWAAHDEATEGDTDHDGLTDDVDTDDDGDGQSDADETACGSDPLDVEALSADLDVDGLPDCVDPDKDGDGVDNESDAFPLDAVESIDTDGDGTGNVADLDDDDDGLPDAAEATLGTDPLLADTDDDGTSDADEDADGDDLTNLQELDHFDSDPIDSDTDGDGFPDGDQLSLLVVNSTEDDGDDDHGDGLCATGDTVGLSEAPECTLRAAVEEAEHRAGPDVISLGAGTFASGDLYTSHNLKVVGAGSSQTILDADGEDRVLYMDEAPTVVFEGVTLTGGDSWDGGAIYQNDGDLTLLDSVVTGNSAGYGGGIYNYTGHLTLDGSSVSGNDAYYSGGGLYNEYGSVTIKNSSGVDDNALDSSYEGGGIYNEYGEIRVTDSSVDGNECLSCDGGGIYNEQGLVALTNSTVSDNDGGFAEFEDEVPYANYGGGIYNEYGKISLDTVTVSGNDAYYEGGGIYSYEGSVDIIDSTISANTTDDGYGGGIYTEYAPLTLTNSHVINNGWVSSETNQQEALTYEGGGIYNYEAPLEWSGGSLLSNAATEDGGGLYNYNNSITLTNVNVDGNWAEYAGGGIYNYGNLTFVNGTITDNHADEEGGGLYNEWISKLVDSTVDGNTAGIPEMGGEEGSWGDGGGIYTDDEGLRIVRSTVSNNSATDSGGGLYVYYDTEVTNSTFFGNSAGYDGGAIYADDDVALANVTVAGNSANTANDGGSGGGIYNSNGYDLELENSIVAENSAGNCTDDVLSGGHNLDDDGSCGLVATGDQSDVSDAGLAATLAANGGPTHTLALESTSVAINAAGHESCPALDQRGVARPQGNACDIGAFEFEGTPEITPGTADFTVNSTDDAWDREDECEGGLAGCTLRSAIELAEDIPGPNSISLPEGTIELDEGDFYISRSTTIVGAGEDLTILDGDEDDRIFYVDTGASVTITDLTLRNGWAEEGGAMYIEEGDVTLQDATVSGNFSDDDGGGLYVYGGHLTLDNVSVTGNESNEDGAGIYSEYGSVSVTNGSSVSSNELTSYEEQGAGIYNDYGELFISNSAVDGNLCYDCEGAGIYNSNGFVSVTDSTVSNNDGGTLESPGEAYAYEGGGIYNEAGKAEFVRTTLSGNDVYSYGGAIYNEDGEVTLEESTVSNNTTDDGDGGGIYNEYGPLTLTDSDVTENGGPSPITEEEDCFFPFGCGDFDPCEIFPGLCEGGGLVFLTSHVVEPGEGSGSLTEDGGGIYNYEGALEWTGGSLSGNTASEAGGGLYNDNNAITLTDVEVSGNTAHDSGGGIYNYGTLTFDSGSLTENAADWGGAIYNEWVAKVTDSTVAGNAAHAGGGVYSEDEEGDEGDGAGFKAIGSTFSGNTANATGEETEWGAGYGAAVFSGETFEAVNSTFANNTTNGAGGAFLSTSDLVLTNVTVAHNTATEAGGGIFNLDDAELKNTIVADNAGGDCDLSESSIDSAGHNLDSDGSCGLDRASDRSDVDAMLGSLIDGEGDTQTVALQPGSPAIDSGAKWVCPEADQRGIARAVDGDVNDVARCDMGAFEFRPSALAIGDAEAVAEGAPEETTPLTFTVTRTGGDGALDVDASVEGLSSDDFDLVNESLSFAGHELSQTVTVNVLGDDVAEIDENFKVKLASARFATLSDDTGTGRIDNDDASNSATQELAAGGTLTTGEATPDSPTGTTITTPNGGLTSIVETDLVDEAPSGWTFFGQQVNIVAPPATSLEDPIVIEFRIDGSVIPDGTSIDTIAIFRNGVEAAATCPDVADDPSDYPCIADRAVEDGDFVLTVRTMMASAWNFARQTAVGGGGDGGGAVPSSHMLTVTKTGNGSGGVVSTPEGIACGGTCQASFPAATVVTLDATPSGESVFAGWSGACTGTDACVVTMDTAKSVEAAFTVDDLSTAASTIKLVYKAKKDLFKATVGSTADECISGRALAFRKQRPGKDKLLAERTTNRRGIAKLRGIVNPRGTFYATVVRTQVTGAESQMIDCLWSGSNMLRLGGPR